MYIRIAGSWANHCEHEIIIPSTTLDHIWLLVDGLSVVVTRPRCVLSFRQGFAGGGRRAAGGDGKLGGGTKCQRAQEYYTMKCLLNEYALRTGLIT